ncbi:hypothetical protein [Pendulispora albinea]|uniref:Uncharacterized protein n=1 Tax=Pendulispora albinea TaxID=2741071 RepID=A0ABZ2LU76_9BACT
MHIDDPETRFEQGDFEQGDEESWTVLCKGPCERTVPAGHYRVVATNGVPIGEFSLDASNPRDLWIRRDLDRPTMKAFGVLSVVSGGVGVLVALAMTFVDSMHCLYGESGSYGRCESERDSLYVKDALVGAASVGAIIGGVALIVAGNKKNPLVFFTSPPDAPPPRPTPERDRPNRPTWLSGATAAPGAPSAFIVPVLSGHF